jgi:chromosome segregation ATPase
MMIHDPWGAAEGNADELRKEAKLLDQMKAVCMSFYRAKFDRTEDELAQLMSEETWYTGAECLANGLKCKVVASDVRASARATSRHFGALPDSAAALIKEQAMTDEVKAKLDALRAAAREEIVAAVDAPIEDNVKIEEKDEANMNEITIAIEDEKSEAVTAPNEEAHVTPQTVVEEVKEEVAKVETPATDWEARFKGASKKINELQSRISDLQKTADEANDKLAAAEKSLVARDAELDKAHAELNAAQGEIKAKCEALAIAEKDLADVRDNLSKATEQVEHLRKTRDILTGGVLTTPDDVNTYEAKIKRAKNAREREALRKAKARGEIE